VSVFVTFHKNDPLHLKSYGTKHDYTQKGHIHYPQTKQGTFFADPAGVVDEWKALMDQRLRKHDHDQRLVAE